jgi:hypothetical protein
MTVMNTTFRDEKPCSLVEVYRCYEERATWAPVKTEAAHSFEMSIRAYQTEMRQILEYSVLQVRRANVLELQKRTRIVICVTAQTQMIYNNPSFATMFSVLY